MNSIYWSIRCCGLANSGINDGIVAASGARPDRAQLDSVRSCEGAAQMKRSQVLLCPFTAKSQYLHYFTCLWFMDGLLLLLHHRSLSLLMQCTGCVAVLQKHTNPNRLMAKDLLTAPQMFWKQSTFWDNRGPEVVWAISRLGCVSIHSGVRGVSIFFAKVKKSILTLDCRRGQLSATGVSPLPIRKLTTS